MKEGDKIDLIIGKKTPLGFVVLINEEYEGLLYHNEIFTPIETGQKTDGYIKKIREDDKIDVALTPQGFKNVIKTNADIVLKHLQAHEGILYLTDKSSPESIKRVLQMSKKNFKRAIGNLYKQKLIRITDDCIELID